MDDWKIWWMVGWWMSTPFLTYFGYRLGQRHRRAAKHPLSGGERSK